MSVVQQSVQDGVGYVTLNRPDKRNALNSELIAALTLALKSVAQEAKVIVLQGAGKSFCAGADLKEVAGLRSQADIRGHAEATGALFHMLGNLPVPTIAAVTGHALGAGCGLVSLCDLAVAAPEAKLGYPEFGHGILPALVTPPLVRAVGKRRALQILTRDTAMSADDALAMGLISEVAADPQTAAVHTARHLAATPPGQVVAFKALLDHCVNTEQTEGERAAIEANISDRLIRMANASSLDHC
ncbi:MAG: enoyl-CoA hydratase/isomerase family protein [Pseudodonghicola sp.]|nr:enoyl-CoA hydratase/isomerase family protein [Pseudodonghicola sp.]